MVEGEKLVISLTIILIIITEQSRFSSQLRYIR